MSIGTRSIEHQLLETVPGSRGPQVDERVLAEASAEGLILIGGVPVCF